MYTLQKHLDYNTWANAKIVEILSAIDEKYLDVELKSSFPTLRKTVMHIWDAQQIWLTRLQGETTSNWPSASFQGTSKDMFDGLLEDSRNFSAFVASKDKQFIESSLTYKNMKGKEFSNNVEDILFHVVNHGTFHRGQIITMLRELGFDKFPSQDLIAYSREL
jgi:uncharacterized damage-inducible protein DinB